MQRLSSDKDFADEIGKLNSKDSSELIACLKRLENCRKRLTRWNSHKKPQFYVKDGKNYSYRVEGSVASANYNEATLVNQAQKELIHGLRQGGNIPLGAVQRLTQSNEEKEDGADTNELSRTRRLWK
ncbi:Ubiquitin system component Cue protein [Abeliophyllum distichum]|uniref:Ubiquitin system component Cue protein n=1 Tax=Abeliophyllum distichum TaxID=126358 RepID=A0ABD1Q6K7_9LAMI